MTVIEKKSEVRADEGSLTNIITDVLTQSEGACLRWKAMGRKTFSKSQRLKISPCMESYIFMAGYLDPNDRRTTRVVVWIIRYERAKKDRIESKGE